MSALLSIRLCGCLLVLLSLVRLSKSNLKKDLLVEDSLLDDAALYKEFELFLLKYDKSSDRLRDLKRFELFKESYKFISRHNSVDAGKPGTSFRLDLNEMADMLDAEIQQLFPTVINPIEDFDESSHVINMKQTYVTLGSDRLSSLNWAGTDNPLGATVMSPVKNQVG